MLNELGLGVLPPDTESRLVARGYTYARRVFDSGTSGEFHLCLCKGDIDKIAAKFLADNLKAKIQLNSTSLLLELQK